MDSGELERLVERHRKALRLLAATICNNPDDAVQQSFIKLATLDSNPTNPAAWLFRVVKNEAISQLRSETRRGRYERKAAIDAIDRRNPVFVSAPDSVDVERLSNALVELDDDIRQIVIARIWGELSFEEIAAEFGCSSSSAHRRYKSGLDQIRLLLGLSWIVERKS